MCTRVIKNRRKIFSRLPKLHKQWMNIKHIWEIKGWPLRIHLSCVCFLLTDSHSVWDVSYDRTSVLKHCSPNANHLTQMGQIRLAAYISLIRNVYLWSQKNHLNTCVCVWCKYPASVLWIPGSVEFLPLRRAASRSYLSAFHSLTWVCFSLCPPLPPGRSEKWHKSFLTFPLQRETKATPLKLRGKYECHSGTKQSYNFLPPTISPCIIKTEKQKPQTHFEEGHLFSLPSFLVFSSCPEERWQYITYKDHNSWGHFYWQE